MCILTAVSLSTPEGGRAGQRRRTRAAIVQAAADLLQSGVTPSVGDVADAADVSRRTVYLYFPNLDQLLLDATLGLLSQSAVDEAIDAADNDGDATERVTAMIRALFAASNDTLPLGRSLLGPISAVRAWAETHVGEVLEARERAGAR